ncbi:hypothetical protein C0J52_18148 [Blattella germanica]|nr:hypothetical protein C0J52_18148 [Blattella germanica]
MQSRDMCEEIRKDGPELRFKWTGDANVCTPIQTYEEVLQYKNFCPAWHDSVIGLCNSIDVCYSGVDKECHSGECEIIKQRGKRNVTLKTLVCHDLKGGYLEDRYVNGSEKHNEYRFFHWSGIDTFIYFSHNLVTIPPPMWINAGHLHGTKVLGTLITEWDDGEKVWMKIMESDHTIMEFAESLVSICVNFGFDGYLLNVENVISQEDINKLEYFVTILHDRLHALIPHAELLWYDSVTSEGKLDWQNELNDLNKVFFNSCDGIFLNYSWNELNLKSSALKAGPRHMDVYVGIDVFGRNFYEGGGFSSYKAAKLARDNNLSLAIFAPSWTHEYLGGPHFVHLENVFWQTMWPYLYHRGPSELPFSTSFCQGYGEKLYCRGQVVASNPWYDLSKQQYQPTVPSCQDGSFTNLFVEVRKEGGREDELNEVAHTLIKTGCVQHYSKDAYQGGGCLQIRLACDNEASSVRIFSCSFKCSGNVLISTATKPLSEDISELNILLQTEAQAERWWILKPGAKSTDMEKQKVLRLPIVLDNMVNPKEKVLRLPIVLDNMVNPKEVFSCITKNKKRVETLWKISVQ